MTGTPPLSQDGTSSCSQDAIRILVVGTDASLQLLEKNEHWLMERSGGDVLGGNVLGGGMSQGEMS